MGQCIYWGVAHMMTHCCALSVGIQLSLTPMMTACKEWSPPHGLLVTEKTV